MISKLVYGNDFDMFVDVKYLQYDATGQIWVDFDLTKSTNIKVNLICEVHKIIIPLEWHIKDDEHNIILCHVIGKQLHIGAVYGIEITGLDEEQQAWRFKNAQLFSVVDQTKNSLMQAGLMDDPLEVNAEIGLYINAVPVRGEQGPAGSQGSMGMQGSQGDKGNDGTVSFEELTPEQKEELRGPRGFQGQTGQQGTQGSRGEKGQDGTVSFEELTPEQKEELRGPQGNIGMQGSQGQKGDRGIDGVQGSKGDQGERGIDGVQGSQGQKGDRGIDGVQGSQGQKGERGIDGVQGSQGQKGDRGIDGVQGPAGQQGNMGMQGSQGQKGDRGIDGVQGPAGQQGNMGMQGSQGQKGDGFDLDPVQLNITDTPAGTQGFELNLISKPITRNEITNLLAFDYEHEYFTITMLESGKIKMIGNEPSLQYSYDKEVWLNLVDHYVGDENYIVPSSTDIYFRATLNTGVQLECTGKYSVSGNIMSLLYGDNFIGKYTLSNDYLISIFRYSDTLIYAHNLVLPATTLATGCYRRMFEDCTNLLTAPKLPATTLTNGCYYKMFQNCSSLTTAPELPATTLANSCYEFMFAGCSSLKTATSILPATTLTDSCYHFMFINCSSLTTAPELPATTLANSCYSHMFVGCSSLTTAPELPATTLATYCYFWMFKGCTNLNYIKCAATDISASNCTHHWLYEVSLTGTFVKNTNMSSWTTGADGIPSGWTVESYTPAPAPVQPIYVETSTSGLKLEVVSVLPATTDPNTIYIIQ